MQQLLLLVIPLPFVGFWFWMFRDMMNNPYLSEREKNDWLLKFILLNLAAAALYYVIEYRSRNL